MEKQIEGSDRTPNYNAFMGWLQDRHPEKVEQYIASTVELDNTYYSKQKDSELKLPCRFKHDEKVNVIYPAVEDRPNITIPGEVERVIFERGAVFYDVAVLVQSDEKATTYQLLLNVPAAFVSER